MDLSLGVAKCWGDINTSLGRVVSRITNVRLLWPVWPKAVRQHCAAAGRLPTFLPSYFFLNRRAKQHSTHHDSCGDVPIQATAVNRQGACLSSGTAIHRWGTDIFVDLGMTPSPHIETVWGKLLHKSIPARFYDHDISWSLLGTFMILSSCAQ